MQMWTHAHARDLPLSIDLVPASILAARTKAAYGAGTISTCTVSKITQYLMLVLVGSLYGVLVHVLVGLPIRIAPLDLGFSFRPV